MKKLFIKSSVLSIAFFVCAFVFAFTAHAQTKLPNPMSGKLVISSSAQSVQAGQTLTVTVKVDSGTEPVNAVQANISYPQDSLEFVKVDSTGTPYDVEAENKHSFSPNKNVNGVVRLARGATKPQTGEQLFSTIEFKAKQSTQASAVTYVKDSEIIRTADNQNILPDGGQRQATSVTQPDATKPNDAASGTTAKKGFFQRIVSFFKNLF